jgi:hypothetical protein
MSEMTANRRKTAPAASLENSIIALDRFIQSTRDSGYKGTVSAIAELVDNALEAGARSIDIRVNKSATRDDFEVAVLDDGVGMNAETLTEALRFGGTTRFNSRSGLGRFGMGLPNASLSQARRVDVFTWQDSGSPIMSYLDVDQIVSGALSVIPTPMRRPLPLSAKGKTSGTLVLWTRCDRLDHRRISTAEKRLASGLGRIFRHFLWEGVAISINGKLIEPIDPIFLRRPHDEGNAQQFQEVITVEVASDSENQAAPIGEVKIIFTELPVAEWHELSNDVKRSRGIANGAGVSIVRGRREVDFGWFFMGAKRRENYDDWWRCEIRFSPDLDDAFGVSHTKQQIRPKEYLTEALQSIVEDTAKALNSRVRQKHITLKTEKTGMEAEKHASKLHDRLRPIPESNITNGDAKMLAALAVRNSRVREALADSSGKTKYLLVTDERTNEPFFKPAISSGVLASVLNSDHLFYRKLYEPLVNQVSIDATKTAHMINLMLLSAARAEAMFGSKVERKTIAKFRKEWSDVFDVLLRA